MEQMTVNGKAYTVLRLLGKGKGGYSWLVTDGQGDYVLKQIHHEPCAYYTFGDKLQSELRDYRRLSDLGIPLPPFWKWTRSRNGSSRPLFPARPWTGWYWKTGLRECMWNR